MLYTGDADGLVACWNLDKIIKEKRFPEYYYVDHMSSIVSIDSNYSLDLHITATSEECGVRVSSTNRFYKKILPQLKYSAAQHKIHAVLLSERGYIVLHLKNVYTHCDSDIFTVYSINGEFIVYKTMDESINAVLFDRTQYFIVFFCLNIDYWWNQ